jgi:thiol-disulfide isomerase/thioredoxin
LGVGAFSAAAQLTHGFPAAYQALVVQPKALGDGKFEFDLTAAVAQARERNKRLYVYLGANDCPYCRRYETFLTANSKELLAHFAPYFIVDLRGSLTMRAEQLYIRVGERSQPYAAFQALIGDERAQRLVYPTVWLLNAQLKPLMQMPAGAGTFMTVPEQIEILQLVQ